MKILKWSAYIVAILFAFYAAICIIGVAIMGGLAMLFWAGGLGAGRKANKQKATEQDIPIKITFSTPDEPKGPRFK